jgi:hypothetical protein
MSLESKIDLLIKAVNEQTAAINAFNGNIEKWLTVPTEELTQEKASEPTPEPTVEPEQDELAADEPQAVLTHKDVQDAVLAFVRKDVKTNKPKVKALLEQFKAQKVGDVSEDKLNDFHTKLGAL